MIQRFLKFTMRKDITKKNTKINHRSLTRSMNITQRIPFLCKYHKKKLIASIVAGVIIYTYDLHKTIIRKIMSMRSPIRLVQSYFVEQKHIPNTILQQNTKAIDLSKASIDTLTKMYTLCDKKLYFGVGRYYLFQIINTTEEEKKFWQASGFFKQRNQKASGVGLVEFLTIFQEGLKYSQNINKQITEQKFIHDFVSQFIKRFAEISDWQLKFNIERNQQFLKNMPGDNQKKKDAIIQLMRQASLTNKNLPQLTEVEQKIKQMGLKGFNFTDQMLFWQLKKTWNILRISTIDKKLSHPLTIQSQKYELEKKKMYLQSAVKQLQQQMKKIEQKYQTLYQDKIF